MKTTPRTENKKGPSQHTDALSGVIVMPEVRHALTDKVLLLLGEDAEGMLLADATFPVNDAGVRALGATCGTRLICGGVARAGFALEVPLLFVLVAAPWTRHALLRGAVEIVAHTAHL